MRKVGSSVVRTCLLDKGELRLHDWGGYVT